MSYLQSLHLIITTYIATSYANSLYPNDDCLRIRRPWHTLSTSERDLYISGLLQIRKQGNGNTLSDEFINIASVHEDEYAPVTHKASSYLFWHGYLTWELETRIRNLGGKYRCFAMPYWDFTIEHGREANPWIFTTGLGGDGDRNDYHTVNEYTWAHTTDEYWVPYNCYAENDKYPICSLKRALKGGRFQIQSAEEYGAGIINHRDFVSFSKWYNNMETPVHLFTGAEFMMSPNAVITSYDPIWYLFHSMVQYHQAIWTDCNEYDLIDIDDLEQHPEAYTPFCIHGTCTHPGKYPTDWISFGLDDVMHFGGTLGQQTWSYIYDNELTVRKLYDLPKWGIVYDLGNGEGFYTKSGLKEYCNGKLNRDWFILNNDGQSGDKDEQTLASVKDGVSEDMNSYFAVLNVWPWSVGIVVLVVLIGLCVYRVYQQKSGTDYGDIVGEYYSYGSV